MPKIDLLPEYQDVVVEALKPFYKVDGVRYQRVTTALGIINKPALIPWAKRIALDKVREVLLDPNVRGELVNKSYEVVADEEYDGWVDRLITAASLKPDEVRDASAALGTEAHEIVRDISMVESPEDRVSLIEMVPDNQRPAVEGAVAFLHDYDITVAETEFTVWDNDLKVAGTIDGIGYRDGQMVIWDWKRSAGLYWETALQLAAYTQLLTNITGEHVYDAYAVRLLRTAPQPDEALYEVQRLGDWPAAWDAYQHAVHLQRASKAKFWEE